MLMGFIRLSRPSEDLVESRRLRPYFCYQALVMTKEVFDTLPYVSRKELIELRTYIKQSFGLNAHLIYEDNVESTLYQFKSIGNPFAFNIQFSGFDQVKKLNFYRVYHSPASLSRIAGETQTITFEHVKSTFEHWINLITMMNDVTEEYFDPHKKFYDDEFSDYFINEDEDADDNPF